MRKAIFFAGEGTAWRICGQARESFELYPETIPALRFLSNRDFFLVLMTPDQREYEWLLEALGKEAAALSCWDTAQETLDVFAQKNGIAIEKSYFITDGSCLDRIEKNTGNIILVLSGTGFNTLSALGEKESGGFADVCRDIYAAAFSVAHKLL